MSRPEVSLVVIHWNDPERFATALGELEQSTVPVRLVVVDNGSESANVAAVAATLEGSSLDTTLLTPGVNLGFGPGANHGMAHVLAEHPATEWVGVMPHDALVSSTALEQMLDVLDERPEVGLACADVGDGCTPVIDPYLGGLVLPSTQTEGWEDAAYPHGTLMLARRGCLEEVGLFDDRYFAYVEEADLGLRARKLGWEIGIVRGAAVHNPFMGPGQAARDYLQQRNTILLVREHSGWWPGAFRWWLTGVQLVLGIIRPSSRPEMFVAKARAQALIDDRRRTYGPPPKKLYQ